MKNLTINETLESNVVYNIEGLLKTYTKDENEYELLIECLENEYFDTQTNTFENDIEDTDSEYRTIKEFITGHLYSLLDDIENGYRKEYTTEYIQSLIDKYEQL